MPGMLLGAGCRGQIAPAFTELQATGESKIKQVDEKRTCDNSCERELHSSVKMHIGGVAKTGPRCAGIDQLEGM